MVECINIFPTLVWVDQNATIDNSRLRNKVDDFSRVKNSTQVSNVGGYHGDGFEDSELFDFILESVPSVNGKEFDGPMFKGIDKPLYLFAWANKNNKGHWNTRHHHHSQTASIFLSGVYYISVPDSSSIIRFWDPRGSLIKNFLDQEYYFNADPFQSIQPKNGMLLLFPPWLEHDVTPNTHSDSRYSIGFNILMKSNVK